jgi:hypothetical protein
MRLLLGVLLLAGCEYHAALMECSPPPWRTEVWVDDALTGRVEATLRETCDGFPDVVTEYRIVGRRPHGAPVLLFEGSIEKWHLRHAVRKLDDGTTEIEVWDRRCRPDDAQFTCSAIQPGP